jgi:hypothetical protein
MDRERMARGAWQACQELSAPGVTHSPLTLSHCSNSPQALRSVTLPGAQPSPTSLSTDSALRRGRKPRKPAAAKPAARAATGANRDNVRRTVIATKAVAKRVADAAERARRPPSVFLKTISAAARLARYVHTLLCGSTNNNKRTVLSDIFAYPRSGYEVATAPGLKLMRRRANLTKKTYNCGL